MNFELQRKAEMGQTLLEGVLAGQMEEMEACQILPEGALASQMGEYEGKAWSHSLPWDQVVMAY